MITIVIGYLIPMLLGIALTTNKEYQQEKADDVDCQIWEIQLTNLVVSFVPIINMLYYLEFSYFVTLLINLKNKF